MTSAIRASARTLFCCGLVLLGVQAAAGQPFTFDFINTELPPLSFGTSAWADVDADGHFDVVLTGSQASTVPYVPHTGLYINDGKVMRPFGANLLIPFQEFTATSLSGQGLWHSAATWGDYDNDGDADLLLLGAVNDAEPFEGATQLYRNDGGQLTLVDAGLPGFYSGSAEWGDYDNDGDVDLLLSGVSGGAYTTAVYRNDDGVFTSIDDGLVDVAFGAAAWGDYDNDGDLDVALSGVSEEGFVARVYRNDGARFVPVALPGDGLAFSSLAWGDYDDDGRLDLALSGGFLDPLLLIGRLVIYHNAGADAFELAFSEEGGYLEGRVAWGDYDNDGDSDLLTLGAYSPKGPRYGRVFEYRASRFEAVLNVPGTLFGDVALGDHDGDGDLDLVLLGLARGSRNITNVYENTQWRVNAPPKAPAGLQASTLPGGATLSWEPGTDDESDVLSYNLRVGTTPGGSQVVSALADAATGRRRLPGPGNAFLSTQRQLTGLTPGTYYWSVQSVDAAHQGSPFAPEGTFTVTAGAATGVEVARGEAFGLEANYPNPFSGRTEIRYRLAAPGPVRLVVYDVLGRAVRTLEDGARTAGLHAVAWDGRDEASTRLAPGLYLYRLETPQGHVQARTMTLLP